MCTGVRCTGVVTDINNRNRLSLPEGEVGEKLENVATRRYSGVGVNNSTEICSIQSIIEIFVLGRCHNSHCKMGSGYSQIRCIIQVEESATICSNCHSLPYLTPKKNIPVFSTF